MNLCQRLNSNVSPSSCLPLVSEGDEAEIQEEFSEAADLFLTAHWIQNGRNTMALIHLVNVQLPYG